MQFDEHCLGASALLICASLLPIRAAAADDCNGNGVDDDRDLAPAFQLRSSVKLSEGLNGPSAVALADTDGDGDPDLVLALAGLSDIAILLNDGKGGFARSATYSAGNDVHSIAVADLDGDGDIDLATADFGSGTLSMLWSQGDGTFSVPESIPAPAPGSNPSAIKAADLDGDGDLDLAAAVDFYDPSDDDFGRVPGHVLILLNDGGGGFSEAPGELPGTGVRPVAMTVGDFDGNGKRDLVVVNNVSGDMTVLLNQGDGAFTPAEAMKIERPRSVAAADIDKDGDDDLIVSADDQYGAFVSQGHGVFEKRFEVQGAFYGAQATAAIDADFDGNLDLCVAVRNTLLVHVGRGDGGFLDQPLRFATGSETPASLEAGDLDGDGDFDFVQRGIDGGFSSALLLIADGAPGFTAPRNTTVEDGPSCLAVSDLDGDGHLDVAVTNSSSGTVSVLRGKGDGSFLADPSFPAGNGDFSLAAADFDGDQAVDLAVGVAGYSGAPESKVELFWNSGDGKLGAAMDVAVTQRPVWIAAADLDGDGKPDIAAAHNELNQASVLWNEGGRAFSAPATLPTGASPWFITAADLDGDGRLDLLTANGGGQVSFIQNAGSRSFDAAVNITVAGPELYSFNVAAADFDGDGTIDLAAPHVGPNSGNDPGTISVLFNKGGASFADPVKYGVGRVPRYVTAADVDGDHDLDLVLAHSNAVSVLLSDGRGRFAPPVSYASGGSEPSFVAVRDLDGDADVDIVVANAVSDDVSIILNDSTPPASLDLNRNGIPDECETRPFHRGDPNGDGAMNISDPISLLGYLFQGGAAPGCIESADADDNGRVDISDAVSTLTFLFQGGPPPAAPGPTGEPCGTDTDAPGSKGDLGCGEYAGC